MWVFADASRSRAGRSITGGNHERSAFRRVPAGVMLHILAARKRHLLPICRAKFDGVTIDAKLIGGQQYEALYARIAEWEKLTGAKVNIISKKNHFELDKEIKSDIASGSVNWCVGSNHSSFAPQYPEIYTDLNKLLPEGRDRRLRADQHQGLDAGRQAGDAAARTVRRFGALLPEEPLCRRGQEEGLQGKVRLRPGAAGHLGGGERPGRFLRQRRRISTARSSPARKRRSTAASTRCWSPRAANISTRTASRPSTPKPACGRSTGSSISTRPRPFRRAPPTISGTISARALPRAPIAINLDWPGWAGFFNDPEIVEGRRQCRRQGAAEGFVRQAHWLVGSSRLLGHRKPAPTRKPPPRWSGS